MLQSSNFSLKTFIDLFEFILFFIDFLDFFIFITKTWKF